MEVALSVIGLVISVHVLGMYAFSPLIGALSDRLGRVKVIQIGIILLLASAAIAGRTSAMNTIQLGIGLFLLGLGWSCTMGLCHGFLRLHGAVHVASRGHHGHRFQTSRRRAARCRVNNDSEVE
jgi:MFS family permease